jgi:phosphohistidine phosphatase SixA
MNIMRVIAFLLAALLAPGFSLAMSSIALPTAGGPVASAPIGPAELLTRLRAGGYTIYFRHAATDQTQDDSRSVSDEDCAHQRNLSAAGRKQASAMAVEIGSLGLPLGTVLASPLCRTMETARLVFGRTQADADVRGGGLGRADYPGLRRLLSVAVPAGTLQAIVGHGHQFQSLAALKEGELDEGEAAIIRGSGNGSFEVVARLRSAEWQALRSMAGTSRQGRGAMSTN